jgi:hypothetical protein
VIGGSLHTAAAPSAQRENRAQQPSAAHWQSRPSTNTGWQSPRASQASRVAICAHVSGHAIGGQPTGGSFGSAQRMNPLPPLQFTQASARQSVRALQDASSRIEQGAGQAMAAHTGPTSVAGL